MLTRNEDQFQVLTLDQLKRKKARLREQWDKFQRNHSKELKRVNDNEIIVEQNEQKELVESQYFEALTSINERIAQLENEPIEEHQFEQLNFDNFSEKPNGESTLNSSAGQSHAMAQSQQPIIVKVQSKQLENTWGEFDGSLTKWQGFHDRFCHAVHNDEAMANADKFQHLQRSLKGRALIAFGDWDGSDLSYPEAWARLNELYNREFQITKELLWKFNNLPKLEYASSGMLQKLSNVTHEVMRQLRAMKYPVEHYDLFLVHPLHDKLDPETRKIYELNRKSERPKIQEMLNFLDQHAKALQGANLSDNKQNKDSRKRMHSSHEERNFDAKRNKFESSNESKKEIRDFKTCRVCRSTHPVIHCDTFKKIEPVSERKNVARKHELCFNCLKPYHSAKECFAEGCRRCNGAKHNSLLCEKNPLTKLAHLAVTKSEKNFRKKRAIKRQ